MISQIATQSNNIKDLWSSLPVMGGYGGAALTALQVVSVVGMFANEMNPDTSTPYGKFVKQSKGSKTTMVSSRTGMLFIYTPALLMSLFLRFVADPVFHLSVPTNPTGIMCALHFLKRDLEVLFVHDYSGSMPLGTGMMIGIAYAMYALLTITQGNANPSEFSLHVGTALFVLGLAGNFYHHCLLANLRKEGTSSSHKKSDGDKKKSRYVAPHGGLFEYVAAPHYLFEICGWIGIALASEHINVMLIAASMSSYLAGRSAAQNKFNRDTFSSKDWPQSRKNLIPFVF
jgi:hypothetical protein